MFMLNKNISRLSGTTSVEKARLKTPIYQSIKDHVLSKIKDSSWLEGSAIPPEESLAKAFDVSRMTVNRALNELSNEGGPHRVQGSGTFVQNENIKLCSFKLKILLMKYPRAAMCTAVIYSS